MFPDQPRIARLSVEEIVDSIMDDDDIRLQLGRKQHEALHRIEDSRAGDPEIQNRRLQASASHGRIGP